MRVWSKEVRQPGLAMSRSLGDNMAKKSGVVATPTVKIVKILTQLLSIFHRAGYQVTENRFHPLLSLRLNKSKGV